MTKRRLIVLGMGAGALWAVVLVLIGTRYDPADPVRAAALGAFLVGLCVLAPIARLAQRRFFDVGPAIDGAPFAPDSGGEIDGRVLTNTVEQTVLALCIWPLAAVSFGIGLVPVLGAGFAVARLTFWVGYHLSPPLRAFGFAATFYPTVLLVLLVFWRLIGGA